MLRINRVATFLTPRGYPFVRKKVKIVVDITLIDSSSGIF